MNQVEKSDHIKAGIQKGFQDGTSKMAKRRCYGYDTALDGTLTINHNEAKVVIWIFERYLQGDSLGEIVDDIVRPVDSLVIVLPELLEHRNA